MKKRLTVLGACLGILVLAASAYAIVPRIAHAATTHTVCASGCDYTDIQSAINAVTTVAGDTIQVKAGTYTLGAQINVSKSLNIIGSEVNVSPRNGPRPGTETIIDASGLADPNGYGFAINAANVTINGFTITGAADGAIYGPTAGGATIEDNIIENSNSGVLEMGGTGISITQNLFQNINGTNSAGGDAIYDDFTFNNLSITDNSILSSAQAITLPEPATVSPADVVPVPPVTVNIDNNIIQNGTFLWNETGSYDNNQVTGDSTLYTPTFGLYLGGQDANFEAKNNEFTNLQSSAIVTNEANYGGAYVYTANRNVTISNNDVDEDVSNYDTTSDATAFDLEQIAGTSTISGNDITFTGTLGTGVTDAYGIKIAGSDTQTLNFSRNVLDGGSVGGPGSVLVAPTSGYLLDDTLTNSTNISISSDVITDYTVGAFTFTSQAATTVAQSCIYNNSLFGAFVATGAPITATNNWWGAASGPNAPTNLSGTGNKVSTGVTFKPFLTAPAPICAGPIASNLATTPSSVQTGSGFTLTATLSDTTTGQFPVISGQYSIDGGALHPMTGTFGGLTANVSATLPAFSTTGTHKVCVLGNDQTDPLSFTGAATCLTLTVTAAPSTGKSGAGGAPTQPQQAQSPASSGASSSPIGTQQHTIGSAPQPSANAVVKASASSFPIALAALIALVLLGLAGGTTLLVARKREASRLS